VGNEIEMVLPEYEQTRGDERGRENMEEISGVEIRGGDQKDECFGGDTIVLRPPPEVLAANQERACDLQPRRSQRQRNPGPTSSANAGCPISAHVQEAQTLEQALACDERDYSYDAWESEVDSLVRKETWVLAPLPANREPIGCRWLFKRKEDGRYKARLVAKCYGQKEGLDYNETYAPVAKFSSPRPQLALVNENNWELEGMDVKTAFLHSELAETVFMDIPEGLHTDVSKDENGVRIVCRLIKSIY